MSPVGPLVILVTHTCTGENPACTKGATVADVHKVGYCVKCHFNAFVGNAEKVTRKMREEFVKKCLPKAIDEKGDIKSAFRCTGANMEKAKASIAGF